MKNILWMIVRPKETIKIEFLNCNFIERWILKRIQNRKKIKFVMNKELKGQTFDSVIVDEFIKEELK